MKNIRCTKLFLDDNKFIIIIGSYSNEWLPNFLYVSLVQCDCKLYIPNIISLSSDDENSNFGLRSACNVINFQLSVYDRWGNLIFSSLNIDDYWDGNYKGSRVEQGAYMVNFEAEFESGEILKDTEVITVLR